MVNDYSAERLALLYHVGQALNSSLELDEVLDRAMDEVIAAVHAERGFLMLVGEGGALQDGLQSKLQFMVARGLDQQTIAAPEFQVSRGIVERVAREGRPLLTSDAQSDAWLRDRASVAGLGLRSILCVPLQVKGATQGVVYVDNRLRAGIFTQADLELLSAIASTAAIAIENARLYRLAVEKGRLERELQMAREVQNGLLPHDMPGLAGWELAAFWQPARVVGGDLYDAVPDLSGSGRLGLIIADVSGKGMPAALFMASTRSILRASLASQRDPGAALAYANRLICADAANGMFLTLCYVLLSPQSGDISYVNAGHNPPLICRSATVPPEGLVRTGILLGFDADQPYAEGRARLHPGDTLVLYTDGLIDAVNASGEEFGEGRLWQAMAAGSQASPDELAAHLRARLADFVGPVQPFDDVTVVIARYTGPAPES